MDLGNIQTTSEPVVWAVGVVRDPVVQFTNSDGQTEAGSAYYWSNYSNIHNVVSLLLNFTYLGQWLTLFKDIRCAKQL